MLTQYFYHIKGTVGSVYASLSYFFALPSALFTDIFGSSFFLCISSNSYPCISFYLFSRPRVVSLFGAVVITASVLFSALLNKIQYYIVTIGIFCASGEAAVQCCYYAILPHYFDNKLGLATGLMNSGSSIIVAVSPYLAAYLLSDGLSRYFFVMGLISALIFPISIAYKPTLPSIRFESAKEQIKDSFQVQILKSRKFICWIASTALWEYGSIMLTQTIVSINTLSKQI
jgi:MFS family permease